MGFRNPITSATAVDTGQGPKGAGVRLYQDTSNPAIPRGVAEWRTGSMDRNATATLSGGGSGGSAFTVDGGSALGFDAPRLGLNIESAPEGSYRPVARIDCAGPIILNGSPVAQPRTWDHPRSAETTAASSGYASTSGWVQLLGFTVPAAPPGDYLITSTVVLAGSVALTASAQLQVAGGDVLQVPGSFARCDLTTAAAPYTFRYPLTGFAGGNLTVAFLHNLASGSAVLFAAGSRLTVAYLGPRS